MITSKIIKDSISPHGKRLTTFELTLPKFLTAEFNTHRMVSKNSASSRAIPFEKMVASIIDTPATPVWWGKNQGGMQAKEEIEDKSAALDLWLKARDTAIESAKRLYDLGIHKQIVNRIIEPWMTTKIVATATDWDNFFHLRNHSDAQPEIAYLAKLMVDDYYSSKPERLTFGEWHIPYVDCVFVKDDPHSLDRVQVFKSVDEILSLDDALILSASLCAQTSYRKSDDSMEKARNIYSKLIGSQPVHASPTEHQGTPGSSADEISGNFRGWKQFRQQIPGNVCNSYQKTT